MRYENAAAYRHNKPLPFPEIDQKADESPLGWSIPQWLAAELALVAEKWHIPPREWLATDNQVRKGMLKHLRLVSQADEAYRIGDETKPDPYAGFFPNEQGDDG
jgi:hypothetical protein